MKLKFNVMFLPVFFFVGTCFILNSDIYKEKVITDKFLSYFEKTKCEFTDKALGIKDSYPFNDSRFYFNQGNDKLVGISLFVPIDENDQRVPSYLFSPLSERKDMKKVEILCSFDSLGELYSDSPEDESICLDAIKFVVENK